MYLKFNKWWWHASKKAIQFFSIQKHSHSTTIICFPSINANVQLWNLYRCASTLFKIHMWSWCILNSKCLKFRSQWTQWNGRKTHQFKRFKLIHLYILTVLILLCENSSALLQMSLRQTNQFNLKDHAVQNDGFLNLSSIMLTS